ncbi:DUF29 domain-containing protein [Rhodoplanes sp. TEM]|uniref:DUF29 domain-containing protein n=1 Tax=Rhodoplanes tepidamans TaxID=200616 RepID=A0ABT5JAG4_RHOTP|nr:MULTISPECIES: DUF29 domain-containing protein [Rhodoplanes]MDC7786438.1 DUF29 domain-containing protein [Rhodoplanes tepidamans]MDC7985080.1 DUF29 domain-containing protein [Rhodoplanes sp. TEM]MDQ0357323.1 hypothetical protein [Rhodoplanes tepidamans]
MSHDSTPRAHADAARTLYDDDILLWSEQQAELIRALGRRRDLPNALDTENVAEEIESVGRSELAAVKSLIRRIFFHLMILAVEPEAAAARCWRVEIAGFHADMRRRYAPSMRQRIDLDALWRSALEQLALTHEGTPLAEAVATLPRTAAIGLDDLLAAPFDSAAAAGRIRAQA